MKKHKLVKRFFVFYLCFAHNFSTLFIISEINLFFSSSFTSLSIFQIYILKVILVLSQSFSLSLYISISSTFSINLGSVFSIVVFIFDHLISGLISKLISKLLA
jgi:hypothetical protein